MRVMFSSLKRSSKLSFVKVWENHKLLLTSSGKLSKKLPVPTKRGDGLGSYARVLTDRV